MVPSAKERFSFYNATNIYVMLDAALNKRRTRRLD